MIILGNPQFATAMLLAGISNSHRVTSRAEWLARVRELPKEETIIANTSVVGILPELKEFKNLITLPDSASEFGSVDDLKEIVKAAVGIEIEV
ncbi:MAG: hypothetical protein KAW41_01670 [Candidatus Diapherotrites archaeon]|nr:hypothetical protein [Candidatus Diapherotrites archaeon]